MKGKIIRGIAWISLSISFVSAYQLDGLEIVSRADRGVPYPEFAKTETGSANQPPKDATSDTETGGILSRAQKLKIADDYVLQKFGSEFKVDRIQRTIGGRELMWPIRYNSHKIKIVIHHTASEGIDLSSTGSIYKYLQDTYKFHAKIRKWGDIGYNFLVGPDGTIYEGRYGGPDAVGAHASYNNHDSVGISVIGNFETSEPNKEQLMSLAKLITVLVKRYHIDITQPAIYHQFVDAGPNYMLDRKLLPIVGHRDIGSTSCPGTNLYAYFPFLYKMVGSQVGAIENGPAQTHRIESTRFYIPSTTWTQRVGYDKDIVKDSCYTSAGDIKIIGCDNRQGGLSITLSKTTTASINSYRQIFATRADGVIVSIWLFLDRPAQPEQTLQSQIASFVAQNGDPRATKNSQKIDYLFSGSELSGNGSQPLHVLLYDASVTLTGYQFACRGVCTISGAGLGSIDWSTGIFYVNPTVSGLVIVLNGGRQIVDSLTLTAVTGRVSIVNYNRNSTSKTPRNVFIGNLLIARGPLTMIDGFTSNKYQIINEVTLDQYMRGIAESNDSEPQEKVNTIYLLSRMYAIYYMGQKNHHPSIATGALYDITDDPRISQKYVGIGYEGLSKKWQKANDLMSGHVLLYHGSLPLLPYFSCSAGFTWGAEKFGWIDTPYLTAKNDLGICVGGGFQGHGVGLSGRGATALARRGYTARQIIEYYYPGVIIKKL